MWNPVLVPLAPASEWLAGLVTPSQCHELERWAYARNKKYKGRLPSQCLDLFSHNFSGARAGFAFRVSVVSYLDIFFHIF